VLVELDLEGVKLKLVGLIIVEGDPLEEVTVVFK